MRSLLALVALATTGALAAPAHGEIAPVRWCGTDAASADRLPDRAGGPQVHVVYAIPSDGEDRFAALASPLATDVAAIDLWWRREDPTRSPRFDRFAFPGCDSRFGGLDITFARLGTPTRALAPLAGRYRQIQTQLRSGPFLLGNRFKKYLVFYDGYVGSGEDAEVCGTAGGRARTGGAASMAIVYLRSACGAVFGNAAVAAHELAHTLGAVPRGAPNACADDAHTCDSSSDLLYPFYDDETRLDTMRLDVGRDDYYGHSGDWFDLQDSRWLLDPRAQHDVAVRVVGSGVVETINDGQLCATECVAEWDRGTTLQLTAVATAGFRFTGWSGACASQRKPTCRLELQRPREVVATFGRVVAVHVAISGRGTVSVGSARCTQACAVERLESEPAVLRAQPAHGWRFVGWSGSCRGSRPACTIRVVPGARVQAVFARG